MSYYSQHLTVEQIIAQLTLIANSRGMGAQMWTNVESLCIESNGQAVAFATGNTCDVKDIEERVEELIDEVRDLKRERDELEDELADVRQNLREIGRRVGA